MAATRVPNPRPQYFDSSGNILAFGKMTFFESGTSTLKTTFADVNETIPNTNPVILTADGRLPNVFFTGTARVLLTDAADNQIFDLNDVGLIGAGGGFDAWNNSVQYSIGSIVEASDGNYYRSLQNNNINNDPTSSPTFWEGLEFIRVWNTNVTYGLNDLVQASDGDIYKSLQAANVGNDPTSSPTFWGDAANVDTGWILLDSSVPTGSQHDVTGIPSTAIAVMVIVTDMDYSTATRMDMEVADDGVFQTTGYDNISIFYTNSSTPSASPSNTSLRLSRINTTDGTNKEAERAMLFKNAATGRWYWTCKSNLVADTFASDFFVTSTGGVTPVIGGTLDELRFAPLSGTFSSGTISVYYQE